MMSRRENLIWVTCLTASMVLLPPCAALSLLGHPRAIYVALTPLMVLCSLGLITCVIQMWKDVLGK